VSAVGFDQLAKFGPAGQVYLKVMPIDGEAVLFGVWWTGRAFVFQHDEWDVKMLFQAAARPQLAGGS
jgi:hypothetical protein